MTSAAAAVQRARSRWSSRTGRSIGVTAMAAALRQAAGLGEGNRPFFGQLSTEDVLLGNPTVCVQGDRVTHLVFPLARCTVDRARRHAGAFLTSRRRALLVGADGFEPPTAGV